MESGGHKLQGVEHKTRWNSVVVSWKMLNKARWSLMVVIGDKLWRMRQRNSVVVIAVARFNTVKMGVTWSQSQPEQPWFSHSRVKINGDRRQPVAEQALILKFIYASGRQSRLGGRTSRIGLP